MARPIEIEVSVDVDVPAERAWQVVANYRYDTAWRAGVRSMTQELPAASGRTGAPSSTAPAPSSTTGSSGPAP
ncbi:hypothetical protein GCM10025864_08280 [Luteimicrobium album]|uniref:Polyketide cyclase n=1 Tax=Luteimicrobium album TaxID=1054550 RepID=A0ABQ6HZD5_9MICO|nr:hypothetical protein [Luteimicrobium album]GMA23069.1 hypothetical protein GCM10025864_08280 [Luteimicrobium album]